MKSFFRFALIGMAVIALATTHAMAQSIYNENDTVIGIDADPPASQSNSPDGEAAEFAFDSDPVSKYLNFAKEGSGIIGTLSGGAQILQGFQFSTANDAPERDPITYTIFGTNDPITSVNNGTGTSENWTLIGSGLSTGLEVDPGRNFTLPNIEPVPNTTAYASYRIFFETLRDSGAANSVQIAEISAFNENGQFISFTQSSAVAIAVPALESSYPGGEAPALALDGDPATKYLNFGDTNSGLIVSNGSAQVVNELTFTTGNDAPGRDPSLFSIYGTNDTLVSSENSQGLDENWTLIAADVATNLLIDPLDPAVDIGRGVAGAAASFSNATAYSAYKVVFTGLRNPGEGIMQVADISFADSNNNSVLKGDVDLDGGVSFLDINPFILLLSGNGYSAEADCDCDGDLDFLDIQPFIDILAGL